MVKNKKIIVMVLFALIMSVMMTSMVYAHAAMAESQGGTAVKFSFSDGTEINGARVIVYNAEGETIGKGKTDKDGIYDYAEFSENAFSLYMNDGEGHAVSYEIPLNESETDSDKEENDSVKNITEKSEDEENPVSDQSENQDKSSKETVGDNKENSFIGTVIIIAAAVIILILLVMKRKKK